MANKPGEANFFPDVPAYPEMGAFQPVYGKFDLTTYIQGASDYEIMAFLVGKYNTCLEAYGTVTKLSSDTITAAHQLQDWINNWFDNLDVQQELNNKVDSMVKNGTFADVLRPLVQGFSSPSFVDSVDKMTDHAKIYVLTSNRHIYQWDGNQFVDTSAEYGQTDNILVRGADIVGTDITFDFNSFPFNTFSTINLFGNNTITNAPMTPLVNGECLTLGANANNNFAGRQVYITEKGDVYVRTWSGTAWSEWNNSLSVGADIIGTNITFDFNSLPFNTFSTINLFGNNTITNAPMTPLVNGECLTLGANANNNFAGRQVYITDKGDVYIRTWNGTSWSEWNGTDSKLGLSVGADIVGTDITFDFNSLPFNTFSTINLFGNNTITNAPMTPIVNGECLTLGANNNNNFAGRQVYITEKGDVYVRTWSGTSWSEWNGTAQTNTIINVGANYSIKTIKEAVAKANTNSTVYVHGGVYDLVAEGVDTSTSGLYFSGTWVGLGMPTIKAELDEPNDMFSVVNAPANDFLSLNGFKIIAHNCRYCVHDEMGGSADRSTMHEYNNCIMTTDTQITSAWESPRCIGSGLGGNVQLIVQNCYFDSIINTPCDFHSDWKEQTAPATVTFTNNYINNGTVSFTNVHTDDDKNLLTAQISNNSMTTEPIIGANFTAHSWNNNIR